MNNKENSSFAGGVAVLTISAIIVKIIGVCYKIPLVRLLGTQGMGYFNAAYDVYALLCIISTTGLPVAISVMMNQYRGQHTRIFRLSLYVLSLVGILGALFVLFFAERISSWIGAPGAAISLRLISPAILFICLTGAFRGYYQGKRNMLPTAISQVIEAVGKLIFGLLFAYIALMHKQSSERMAASAVFGLSVGTLLCLLYLSFCRKKEFLSEQDNGMKGSDLLRQLMAFAFPITLSAALSGLSKMIDLGLIMRRLQDAGLALERSVALYGCYSAMVVPLYSAVPALFGSVAMPLIPHLSYAIEQNDISKQRELIESSMRLTALISIPCAIGMGMLADPILSLLFRGSESLADAVPLLLLISMAIPAGCLITLTNAILQAYGRAWLPMLATAAGCTCKAIILYIFAAMPQVGILAAPLSTLVCCIVTVFLNLLFISGIVPSFSYITPWLSGVGISAVSIGFAAIIKRVLQKLVTSQLFTVIVTVTVAAAIYFIIAYMSGLFRTSDIRLNIEKEFDKNGNSRADNKSSVKKRIQF